MTTRRLQIWALWCGLVAALIMAFFPPSVARYTIEGRGYVDWVGKATAEGETWGLIQWLLSYLGPLLLVVSFLLQLLALKRS